MADPAPLPPLSLRVGDVAVHVGAGQAVASSLRLLDQSDGGRKEVGWSVSTPACNVIAVGEQAIALIGVTAATTAASLHRPRESEKLRGYTLKRGPSPYPAQSAAPAETTGVSRLLFISLFRIVLLAVGGGVVISNVLWVPFVFALVVLVFPFGPWAVGPLECGSARRRRLPSRRSCNRVERELPTRSRHGSGDTLGTACDPSLAPHPARRRPSHSLVTPSQAFTSRVGGKSKQREA